jgi:DnaK suppressor protein
MRVEPHRRGQRAAQEQEGIAHRLGIERAAAVTALQQRIAASGDASLAPWRQRTDAASVVELALLRQAAPLQRELGTLRALDHALQRLAAGSYGKCVDCGKPIEAARLEAFPTTYWCTACKRVFERHRGIVTP